jgi:hypothetical protein
MSDVIPILAKEEIAKLPRWAQVAFAARCARRVQPLFVASWPDAPAENVHGLDKAIRLPEESAARAVDLGASRAGYAVLAGSGAEGTAAGVTYVAAIAAGVAEGCEGEHREAAASIVGSTPGTTEDEASAAAQLAASLAAKVPPPQSAASRAAFVAVGGVIRGDFELLLELAKAEKWDDATPVGPEVFGPMWPDGAPEGWPQPQYSVYIDPGDADDEELVELFEALAELDRAAGGVGVQFVDDDSEVYTVEGVVQ